MKLTSLIIATTALLFSACSQESGKVATAVDDAVAVTQEVVEEVQEEVVEEVTIAALINPNTADVEVISAIPGVGAELAQQIISGRPYATPTELHAVIGGAVEETELKGIYSVMFVKVDLNTGSNADYQLIPTSLSPRKLAHEFEEYRPYESMEQFSREMSKYVSAEEVAFLQRYVIIN